MGVRKAHCSAGSTAWLWAGHAGTLQQGCCCSPCAALLAVRGPAMLLAMLLFTCQRSQAEFPQPPPPALYRKGAVGGSEPADAIRAVNSLLTRLDQLKASPNVMVLTTRWGSRGRRGQAGWHGTLGVALCPREGFLQRPSQAPAAAPGRSLSCLPAQRQQRSSHARRLPAGSC